jgi:alkyl hydroperoxide reductase subunit AhpC
MIQVGKQAPDFQNITAYHKGEFHKVNLSDYRGKWLVFFFYPRDFTFICPTEIRGFAKACGDFKSQSCNILACSTDSEWSHKNWFERDLPEVDYPILADVTLNVSKAYDVYDEVEGQANRGLFIIDPEGIVKYTLISAASVGRSVTETMRVLKALQSGDLCPAEWNQGEKTLSRA